MTVRSFVRREFAGSFRHTNIPPQPSFRIPQTTYDFTIPAMARFSALGFRPFNLLPGLVPVYSILLGCWSVPMAPTTFVLSRTEPMINDTRFLRTRKRDVYMEVTNCLI